MTTPPKPRWFRFSLRTLFVLVTVVACWLGWQLNWIRQRREFLKAEAALFVAHEIGREYLATDVAIDAPWPLGLFGETGRSSIYLYVDGPDETHLTAEDQDKVDRAARLFPECAFGMQHVGEDSVGRFYIWTSYIPSN